jgi:hypothetical protein
MKTKTLLFKTLMLISLFVVASCSTDTDDKDDNLVAPSLPPEASMVIDFGSFENPDGKSSIQNKTNQPPENSHWVYSAVVVGVWHTALATTLAVPVASFRTAFNHQAVYKEDATWEWAYVVEGFTSQYSARLTGQLSGDDVLWKMYITKTGINAFDEFLWFSGSSKVNGLSGYWMLNHSAEHPENMLRIDWEVEAEEVGNIKYTYVRALNNEGETDNFNGSYINYGLQTGVYDAFYNVYAYDFEAQAFVSADIEWSRTNYNGRVMAEHYFNDTNWHCWNSDGENIDCE